MRMRTRNNLYERIDACAALIADEAFLARRPLHMEIGCGKGGFIRTLAAQTPDISYLAIERVPNVAVLALEGAAAENIPNVRFKVGDAAYFVDELPKHFCERIYLNFSDPWPKKRYYKRRLTHAGYLELYKSFLAPGGEIHMKTDNNPLFEYSLETFPECGFEITLMTRDLHQEYPEGNVMTEYETRFCAEGLKINKLIAVLN